MKKQTGVFGHKDGSLSEARFTGPVGILIDKDNNLIVSDGASVRLINLQTQQVQTIAGSRIRGKR